MSKQSISVLGHVAGTSNAGITLVRISAIVALVPVAKKQSSMTSRAAAGGLCSKLHYHAVLSLRLAIFHAHDRKIAVTLPSHIIAISSKRDVRNVPSLRRKSASVVRKR